MTENLNNKPEKKKTGLVKSALFGRKREQLNIFQEEQIQNPWKTVIKTFASNKLSMGALILFLLIAAFMFIAPNYFKIDLGYNEPMQANLPPSQNYMKFPDAMKSGARDVSVGSAFSVGVDKDGKFHAWGEKVLFAMPDLEANAPKDMGELVKISAGYDHVLAIDKNGKVWAWGNGRNGQTRIPPQLRSAKVKDVYAGYKFSLAVTEDGKTIAWGNTMNFDYFEMHKYQGKIAKIAMTTNAVTGLTTDGQIVYLGTQKGTFSMPPEGKFTDITATSKAFAAIKEDGTVVDWGNLGYRKDQEIPKFNSKPVSIKGGLYHVTAQLEDGSVVAWGVSDQGQTKIPEGTSNVKLVRSGFYQNYYQTAEGNLGSFGLKGYSLGTDDFGRDVLTRIVNGGRLSMTIGTLAVIISTIIGMVLG
ncbi:MAG: peptide ABC transporter permease, partial [Clostridiaceae bacterium]